MSEASPASRGLRPSSSGAPVFIFGGGLTGLSAAYHLQGQLWELHERADQVGGHARSYRREGHTFDVTGHWLHLREDKTRALLRDLFEPETWLRVDREVRIHSHEALLRYPFQANLHGLPAEIVWECLEALRQARLDPRELGPEASFRDFVRERFGEGIARHFFIPYNRKLWGEAFDSLDASWVSRYLPVPEDRQIVEGALGVAQEGLGYNAHFLYPREGGIDRLPQAMARALHTRNPAGLRVESELEEIDLSRRRVKLSSEEDWRSMGPAISTLPLPELIARIRDAPAEIREAAAALRWVSWHYLNLALREPAGQSYHWAYVPEPRYPFFRVGIFDRAMPSMAPKESSSLYVELQDRAGPPELKEIYAGLSSLGVMSSPQAVRFCEARRIEYAYVVFDEDYAPARARLLAWLEANQIRSCGRYGSWVYNSMEDSLLQGMDAASWAQGQGVASVQGLRPA